MCRESEMPVKYLNVPGSFVKIQEKKRKEKKKKKKKKKIVSSFLLSSFSTFFCVQFQVIQRC